MKKAPDWTRTGTIEGFAHGLRKQSGAFVVLVLRRDDAVLAVDPEIAPGDARDLLAARINDLVADLAAARAEKRKAGRVQLGEIRE